MPNYNLKIGGESRDFAFVPRPSTWVLCRYTSILYRRPKASDIKISQRSHSKPFLNRRCVSSLLVKTLHSPQFYHRLTCLLLSSKQGIWLGLDAVQLSSVNRAKHVPYMRATERPPSGTWGAFATNCRDIDCTFLSSPLPPEADTRALCANFSFFLQR